MDKMSQYVEYLERVFKIINSKYYNNFLPNAMITIQKTSKNVLGYITTANVWSCKDSKDLKEININSVNLNRSAVEICTTLAHEMVHLYNMECGINDVSNNGRYHNKRFKEQAEKVGLLVEKRDVIGWSVTKASKEFIDLLESEGLIEEFESYRKADFELSVGKGGTEGTGIDTGKKKTSTRKYICASCGTSFRATKDIQVLCIPCKKVFIKVDA